MKKTFIAASYITTAFLSVLFYELYQKKHKAEQQIKLDKLASIVMLEKKIVEINKQHQQNKLDILKSNSYADSLALDSLFKILPRE